MNNKSNISGFTLFEFFMSLIVIVVISGIVVPIVMYIIKQISINAFKNDAYGVIEAAKIYVARDNFKEIPEEGIEISKLNLNLKNNNFDGGIIKKLKSNEFEVINLTRNGYCARGTTDDMKATDNGCGSLDKTKPTISRVFVKEINGNDITVIGSGFDNESKIKYYEFSIDGKKYTKKSTSNEYTFKNVKDNKHTVKVKVINEAGLEKISKIVKVNLKNYNHINCYERNDLELYQVSKNVICKYPSSNNYKYQYSLDHKKWIDIKLSNRLFKFNIRENKTIYTRVMDHGMVKSFNTIKISNLDKTLIGAYPELYDNMIPVIYDYNKQAWVKADRRVKYFDYENKIWANAVYVRRNKDIDDLNSHSRDYYLSDDAIGEVIYNKDIIAHYVWIPRFRYKLFNLSDIKKEPVLLDVFFEDKDNNILDNMKLNTYITHKAFTYQNTNGFWISKYQSNVSETSSCYTDSSNCDKSDLLIYAINSNKNLTNISLSNAHLSTKNMNNKDNIYGMSSDTIPHVITNLEYGALLYLTNSKYGIGKNPYIDSSTGNITGVFDLNSNYPEMVMGNYNNDSGLDEENNSGFKKYGEVEWPIYIDYYNGITSKNRILGDATGETNNWYGGYSKFVSGEAPFFIRGGVIDGFRSIYNYSSFTGSKNESYSFRTALIK